MLTLCRLVIWVWTLWAWAIEVNPFRPGVSRYMPPWHAEPGSGDGAATKTTTVSHKGHKDHKENELCVLCGEHSVSIVATLKLSHDVPPRTVLGGEEDALDEIASLRLLVVPEGSDTSALGWLVGDRQLAEPTPAGFSPRPCAPPCS
jgi:hypothetical protein